MTSLVLTDSAYNGKNVHNNEYSHFSATPLVMGRLKSFHLQGVSWSPLTPGVQPMGGTVGSPPPKTLKKFVP